jgi:hypothetical protein
MDRYTVRLTESPPALDDGFESEAWRRAEEGRVAIFRPEGSGHRPETRFRLLHDDAHVHVRFEVRDRYVRSVQTQYQGPVCTDSCVEFFVAPRAGKGYFNFEINAGGTLLLYYIEDCTPVPGGFAKFVKVPDAWGRQVRIWHSLPAVVDPELAAPTAWGIGYRIPVALLEEYVGPLGRLSGQTWRANLYKCGDQTSHPHWASWAPLPKLSFHLPACFGELALA